MEEREIRRGDIYHADLNPILGSEQGGYRPVLVIQNNRGNKHSPTVIVAAITSRPKHKMPTHVLLKGIEGLEKDSVVLLEQLRTVDTGMRKLDKPILMCLCPVCAKPFFESREHFIQRADKNLNLREICMFCNVRQGYDYYIRKKYNNQ